MTKPKLLVFLLIICGNSLPFLWHKSFWKSVKDVCLACCAISIGTEKCIWGECVDALTKECTPFFQRIQSEPLKYLGQGGYHEIHAIGNTNLVSKGLDGNDWGDNRFVTGVVHRLPIEYGITRPICVMESEKNQYKVISQRVIPLESHYFGGKRKHDETILYDIIDKYKYTIHHVFIALAEWIRNNSGLAVNDWQVIFWDGNEWSITSHNIALTPTGEPTFFDFDDPKPPKNCLEFDRRATSVPKLTEELIKNAKEKLEIAMGNPEWKTFTKEVLKIINFRFRTPVSKCTYD